MTGNFRRSEQARFTPTSAPAALQRARLFAVWRFEMYAQWREPLTVLYLLVFGLLAFGYAASNAVELVSNRGVVPRTSSWALMLAFGGLTAFGQVITTMIATTAMLRDEAQRTRDLIATSGLGPLTWFVARVAAALCIMLVVYAAMPIGIVFGTFVRTDTDVSGVTAQAAWQSVRAFVVITAPTMVVVTLLLASAAAYTQRVLGVLAAALALVGIWQLALALVAQPHTAAVGALMDPFANAPVIAMTRDWSDAQRTVDIVPIHGLLLWNRLLWFVVAFGVSGVVLMTRANQFLSSSTRRTSGHHDGPVPRGVRHATTATKSLRHFTAAWMQRDGGWRIVSLLAVANAIANAATRPVPTSGSAAVEVLLLVSTHARIFLILLATVYAGELVWRERDVRIDQLLGALPVSRRTLLWGRMSGLLTAQRQIMVPLLLAALIMMVVRTGAPSLRSWQAWSAWSVFVLWLPFAQLTVLSLTVHVLLDQKVLAHLLLITGWVLAVVLDERGTTPWWLRFAEAAPLLQNETVQWGALMQRGAYWSAVSAALLLLCWWRWPTGGITASTSITSPITSR